MFAEKELDQITNIINDFLAPFHCIAEPGIDFSYYNRKNKITFALAVTDIHADTFINFIESIFPTVHADIFLWSLLHELGHHETEDDFEDEDEDYYYAALKTIKTDEEYYNLPQEYAATIWAGEYMETHQVEVARLWNDLAPAIQNFYKKMEVIK